MKTKTTYIPSIAAIEKAAKHLKDVVIQTPLQHNMNLSHEYQANILLKREDLQLVRSYKIRGAYHKISTLSKIAKEKGIVCASAGNHAQGVAYSCQKLQINGTIYMPTPTPKQKIEQVKMFGGKYIKIVLKGDTFDAASKEAIAMAESESKTYIPPFDDEKIIEGQATVALELLAQSKTLIDYIFVPVGGGGLISGILAVIKNLSPRTKVIGVEPSGAPSMCTSLEKNKNTTLTHIDKFVDGAAVQRVGEKNFEICKEYIDDMITVSEGKVCKTILQLYNKEAIVVEPAGALTIAALDQYKEEIQGKNVICIVSGSNNDITRMAEIKERALLYENVKHYFVIRFPQRAGALKEFVSEVLGPTDDITHFEYSKKHARENGPAIVGIELKHAHDLQPLIQRMKAKHFYSDYLNTKPDLFQFLV